MSLRFSTYICWFQILIALCHQCAGIPILYPANAEKSALVEDLRSGEVVSVQGAFKKFLCSNQDPDQLPFTNTECSDLEGKIVLRTSKSTIRLALSDVDDNGVPLSMAPFGNILPQTNDTDAVATIDTITSISDRLSEFTVKINEQEVPILISWRTRSLTVIWDSTSPREVLSNGASDGLEDDPPYITFLAGFTEKVVPKKNCDAGVPRLEPPETVSTFLDKTRKCSQDLTEASFKSAYQVTRAIRSKENYDKGNNLLTVTAYPDSTPVASPVSRILVFRIISGKMMDYAGNEVTSSGSSVGNRYIPPKLDQAPSYGGPSGPPPAPKSNVDSFNTTQASGNVGKAATAVMAATAVTSLSGTVAAAIGSSGGGAVAGPSMGSIVNLLNMGQKIFLLGKLAVKDVPEEFKAFSSQMQWTMLDTERPWEPKDADRKRRASRSAIHEDDDGGGSGDDDDGAEGDDDGGGDDDANGGDDDANGGDDDTSGGDDDTSEIDEDSEGEFEIENDDELDDLFDTEEGSDDEETEVDDDSEEEEIEFVTNQLNSFFEEEEDDDDSGGDSDDDDFVFQGQALNPFSGIRTARPQITAIVADSVNTPNVGIADTPPVKQGRKNENKPNNRSGRGKRRKDSINTADKNVSTEAANTANDTRNADAPTSTTLSSKNGFKATAPQHPKDEFAMSKFHQAKNFGDVAFEGDPHDVLKRVIFWVFIIHGVLFALHVMVVIFFKKKKKTVPSFLYFPRLEIYTAYWTMPAVATACASLFHGNSGDQFLGVFVLLLLPGSFLLAHIIVIYQHFIKKNPMEWEARVLLSSTSESALLLSKQSSRSSLAKTSISRILEESGEGSHVNRFEISQENIGNEPRCSTNDVKIPVGPQERPLNKPLKKPRSTGFWYKNPVARIGVSIFKGIDKVFLHFWVGPPIDKGEWTKTHSKNNLLDRYGPMFEDCRCVRMVMTRAPSFTLDPTTGKFDRGEYQPVMESVPLIGNRSPIRMHHLQVFATTANFVKLIIFAIIIGAEDNDESLSQLVILLILSSGFVVFFRVSRPYLTRYELALAILAEVADIVTFILGVCLILGPELDRGYRRNLGLGMLWIEGIAFGLILLERFLVIALFLGEQVLEQLRKRSVKKPEPANLMNALWKVLAKHPGYLKRKFFHRWMVLTLGKGLTGRVLVSDERKLLEKKLKKKKQFSFGSAASFVKSSTKIIR